MSLSTKMRRGVVRKHENKNDGDGRRTLGALSPAERLVARFLPSIADAVFACVLLGVLFGLQGKALGPDGDVGWGLRIGASVLDHGIPRAEFMLGPTYGHPVVYWEWLSQSFYALANRAWGLNGVVALAALLVAATSVGLFIALRRRGVALILALALTVAGIGLTSITWTARAQLFSLPLTLLWSELLWRYWRTGDHRILWTLPAIMALWANLHGGFLAGLILLTTALAVAWLLPTRRADANPRHLSLALVGCALATLLNPWGLGLWGHIVTYAGNPLIARYTQEYQSPDFHTLSGLLFLGLVFATVGAWLRLAWLRSHRAVAPSSAAEGSATEVAPARPRERPVDVGAEPGPESAKSVSTDSMALAYAHVAVWTALAFTSVRFAPLWALIALPILGETVMAAV
ncbi:MAG TPA: hypothetical protein VJN88_01870, partial [Ktedonobacterales bacterium]|nr:hypothetical protein [Ktedonobacterales bacterium]